MRAGSAAGGATQADFGATVDPVALLDFEFGEMQVEAEQALAVVDHHAISFEVESARQKDGAGIDRHYWRARADAVIQTLMDALGHAIEDAARAEDVGTGRVDRR